MDSRRSLARRLGIVALSLFGNAVFFWQLRRRVVRFASPVVNDLVGFALGLCSPWLAAVAIFLVGRWWSRVAALIATVPLMLYSAVFLFGSAMVSFDQFAETHWKGSAVRLYRLNGGATTDWDVVIRQERTLLPGVKLVRNLDSFYHCHALNAAPTERGIVVTDERSDCEAFHESRREYRLRPFIYF